MARINIEEKWKTDPRRTALAKRIGTRAADGMLVEISWLVLAHKGQPIPLKEFEFIEDHKAWIECGLAEVCGEFVRVCGAEQYSSFFEKQQNNGKKGASFGKLGGRPKSNKTTNENPQETPKNPQKRPSISVSISPSNTHTMGDSLKNLEQDPVKNKTLIQETRLRLAKEIKIIESLLEAMFPGGQVPKKIKTRIPEMLIRCNGSAADVQAALEDLYQNPKVSDGVGLSGPRANYVAAAVLSKFDLRGEP